MNQGVSDSAYRGSSKELYKIEGFYEQKKGETKKVKKIDDFRQGHLPLGESLTRLITSLVLTRKFQID